MISLLILVMFFTTIWSGVTTKYEFILASIATIGMVAVCIVAFLTDKGKKTYLSEWEIFKKILFRISPPRSITIIDHYLATDKPKTKEKTHISVEVKIK